jgi:serine/threonine kinase 38
MKKEAELLREKYILLELLLYYHRRQKLSIKDFKSIDIIGRGAFGEVRLCKWEKTQQLVAVKKMKKTEMIFKN